MTATAPLTLLLLIATHTALLANQPQLAFGTVRFEENHGQTDPSVRYAARAQGLQIFFTDRDVILSSNSGSPIRLAFPGAGKAQWAPVGAASSSISYFVGNDPAKWVKGAPVYDRIVWRNAHPGIDVTFYGNGGQVEYDLSLAAGADPSKVRLRFDGASRLQPNRDGAIEIASGATIVRQRPPHIYQQDSSGEQRKIEGRFIKTSSNELQLQLENYERSTPLIVDPVLELATYVGGENDDEIVAVTDGFIAGNTRSWAFPGTTATVRGSRDVFIRGTGLAIPDGQTPFYGTVIFGGSDDDEVTGIVATGSQYPMVYAAGTTKSTDLPASGQSRYNGGASDGFVLSILYSGMTSSVRYVGYVGGSGEDRILSIAGAEAMYAIAGVTDSPDLPTTDRIPSAFHGRKDAFYGVGPIESLTFGYLGGSGDDIAYAAAVRGTKVWIGGETTSGNFPESDPGLRGPSDAFLTEMTFSAIYAPELQKSVTYRIGGSGEDRINALIGTPVNLMRIIPNILTPPAPIAGVGIAGTTTSPDLPLKNPIQAQLNGASDLFVGMWDVAGGTPKWLTYLGGSEVDEATTITQNWAEDLYIGGWTRSTDLPVYNPLQANLAGGEDGLFAVFEADGSLRHVSYYGGSGNDRVRGASMLQYAFRLVGSSTSKDLPEKKQWQKAGQLCDGFLADIGTDHIATHGTIILAKDGSTSLNLRLGRSVFGIPVTYRSSDPSRVRFAYFGRNVDEITALAEETVRAEALDSSGEVEIEVSAQGFASRKVRVKLYPGAFVPMLPTTISTWADYLPAPYAAYRAIDPETGKPIGPTLSLRSGARSPNVQWTSSDPGVLAITTHPSYGIVFQALRPGQANITLSVDGYTVQETGSTTVTVGTPQLVPPTDFRLGQDLQTVLPIAFSLNNVASFSRKGTLTARSENPAALLFSLNSSQVGRESVTVPMEGRSPSIYAQALGKEGQVRVILTSTEFEGEFPITVTLEPSIIRWGQTYYDGGKAVIRPELTIALDQSQNIAFALESESGSIASGVRPGAPPLTFTLANSDPSIVETNRITYVFGSTSGQYSIRGLAPGTSELSIVSSGDTPRLANRTARVTVQPQNASLWSLPTNAFVGKNLQTQIKFFYMANEEITVTSPDTSALLVSSSPNERGSGKAVIFRSVNSNEYGFYIQALKDQGEVRIRLTILGIGDREIAVKLLPSGVGLVGTSSFASNGFDRRVLVRAYALDERGQTVLASQIPLPDARIPVRFRAEGSPIRFSRQSLELTAASPQGEFDITMPPPGAEATLLIESAGEFPIPSSIGTLPLINTPAPALSGEMRSFVLSRDALFSYDTFQGIQRPASITVTSSDPSRVLISTSPTEMGSPSLQISGSLARVYIHAIADSGSAVVRFEAAGRTPSEINIALRPIQFAIPDHIVTAGTTIPGRASVSLSQLRPGVDPLRFRLRSANPAIATVRPEIIEWSGDVNGAPPAFEIIGIAAGTTDLIVEGPEYVYVVPGKITVAPSQPQLRTYQLGKNLQGAVQINLGAPFPTSNPTVVTLTSADPERIRLSNNSSSLGSSSVDVTVPPGETWASIYVQALAGDGEVILKATIDGTLKTVAQVKLEHSWVSCYLSRSEPVQIGMTADAYCQLRYSVDSSSMGFQNIRIRPETETTARISSAAPDVVALDSELLDFNQRISTSVYFRAISTGTSELRIEPPSGFSPAPDGSDKLPITVVQRSLGSSCGDSIAVGQDTQITCSLPSGLTVTATSLNPQLVLISGDPRAVGAASINISNNLTIQALAASGTTEVILSAPGYLNTRIAVVLRRTQLSLNVPYNGQSTLTLRQGATTQLSVALRESSGSLRTIRPGANIFANLAADSGIVTFEPTLVNFGAESQVPVRLLGVTAGSTVIRMTGPPGVTIVGSPIVATVTP